MIKFGSVKEIFLILGGVIVFLFVFYIVLVLTTKPTKKPSTTTTTPQIISNKCINDKDCIGNNICSKDGDCVCPPWFTGENCTNPIFSYDNLMSYTNQLNDPNVTEETINNIFNNLKTTIPGNYKNKQDMLNVISSLQSLIDPNVDKTDKQKYVSNINNIIQKECQPPKVLCNDNCINLGTNLNCNSCGDNCNKDGKYCVENKCEDCPSDKNKCVKTDGTIICTDINIDYENCGSCGNICQNGTICSGSKCVCPENSVLFEGKCVNNDNSQYKTCGNTLIDSSTNEDHCGTCDNKCKDSEKCSSGTCVCKEGYAKCDDTGLCVPLNSKDNCGTCGNKCINRQDCVEGSCVCPNGTVWFRASDSDTYSCVTNTYNRYVEFNGVYYDTLTSSERCGQSGITCRADQKCDNGTCVCANSDENECNGKCVNYKTSEKNCGDCNKHAPANTACVNGVPAGLTDGNGNIYKYCGDWKGPDWDKGTVANIMSDSDNCGECNIKCLNGKKCIGGECKCPEVTVWYSADGTNYSCEDNSKGDFILCGDTYYNKNNNKEHCGTCDTKCRDDQSCVNGKCTCTESSFTDCDGKCVDTFVDKNNCGTCKNVCPDIQQECEEGECVCPVNTVWYRASGSNTYSCVTNTDGRYVNFDGVFYDTLNSSERCGQSGIRCRTDQRCVNGTCVCIYPSKTECNGACIDLNTDNNNCGGCEQKVPDNTTCQGGKPVGTEPFSYCPTDPWPSTNYTVPDTSNDTNNCGSCGNKCGPNQICTNGNCVCASGFTYCKESDSCVDLTSDDNNCKTCGNQCNTSAGMRCVTTQKQVDTKKDADGTGGGSIIITTTRCECPNGSTNIQMDRNNCGACGVKCRSDQVCTGGNCVCPTGKTECNGVCVDIQTDNNNCGTCGTKCDPITQTCIGGKCVCKDATKTNCDGTCVDIQTDPNNCGSCGKKVPTTCTGNINTRCVGGVPVVTNCISESITPRPNPHTPDVIPPKNAVCSDTKTPCCYPRGTITKILSRTTMDSPMNTENVNIKYKCCNEEKYAGTPLKINYFCT